MRILISNDDGVYSPGIAALAKAAKRLGEVRIVAPDVEQSSTGHAITASRPLRLKRVQLNSFDAYRVNGTPADCVAVGFSIAERFDVVLSGINMGHNLGNSMWHSGTLAGAKQAALMGSRGIALRTCKLLALGVTVGQGGDMRAEQDREPNQFLNHIDDPLVVVRGPHPLRRVKFLERLRHARLVWGW